MTQSDAYPSGDQEIVGLIRVRQCSFLEIDYEIFSSHSLPSADSRSTVVSFWQKNMNRGFLQVEPQHQKTCRGRFRGMVGCVCVCVCVLGGGGGGEVELRGLIKPPLTQNFIFMGNFGFI